MSERPNQMVLDSIQNDLGWLDELKIKMIDGRPALGSALDNGETPINVGKVMLESEFVSQWLMRFALGNAIGINYFDQKTWFKYTAQGTRSLLVVAPDGNGGFKPTLIVPPLISTNLSAEDYAKLRFASAQIYATSQDSSKKGDLNANYGVAAALADEKDGLQAKQLRFQDLITPAFFARFNIIPEVEQMIYYIRDVARKQAGLKTDLKDLDKAREILYRDYKKEPVSNDDYYFIYDLSERTFVLEGRVKTIQQEEAENAPGDDVDPLSC